LVFSRKTAGRASEIKYFNTCAAIPELAKLTKTMKLKCLFLTTSNARKNTTEKIPSPSKVIPWNAKSRNGEW